MPPGEYGLPNLTADQDTPVSIPHCIFSHMLGLSVFSFEVFIKGKFLLFFESDYERGAGHAKIFTYSALFLLYIGLVYNIVLTRYSPIGAEG